MRKILPVNPKTEITLYPHHSLPLSVPFIDKDTMGWYMNNFINIFYRYEYPTVYDFTDYKYFYTGVMDVDTFTVSTAVNFISEKYFEDFVNTDKYIYAWADQYYIPETEFFNKKHNIHPILVYGYDSEKEIYLCKCFSVTKSVYEAEIKFSDYHKAIMEASKVKACYNQDEFFRLFKVRDGARFEFMINDFADEIYNYTAGKGSFKDSYYSRADLPLELENVYHYGVYNYSVYGIEVTKLLYEALSSINIRCFDYRLMHMVCENKKLISQRLLFVCENFVCSGRFKELALEYSDIAAEYGQLRYLAMKLSLADEKNFYEMEYSESNRNRLCDIIKELYLREKELLYKILEELFKVQLNKSFAQYKIEKFNIQDKQHYSEFDKPECVNSIVLCSYDKKFSGNLFIGDDKIEIDAVSSKNFYVVELNKSVSNLKFIPDKKMAADLCIGVFAVCEQISNCRYIASSTHPSVTNKISPANLAEYDTSFWCSDIDDSDPYIEAVFDEITPVNTLLIEQFISEKRLSEILLQAYINDTWVNILQIDSLDGQQLIKRCFPEVASCRYKLRILKTIASENGYSMPNLMLLKLFKE